MHGHDLRVNTTEPWRRLVALGDTFTCHHGGGNDLQVQLLGNYNFFIYDADEFGSWKRVRVVLSRWLNTVEHAFRFAYCKTTS